MKQFAETPQDCYPLCKEAPNLYAVSDKKCSLYIWKETKNAYGNKWYKCQLLNINYDLGLKKIDENFKKDNLEGVVGFHECEQQSASEEWEGSTKTGNEL